MFQLIFFSTAALAFPLVPCVGWCILVTFIFVLHACALGAKTNTPCA